MMQSGWEGWQARLKCMDHAFQPIVNIHTGKTFGVEALLRNHEKAGFFFIDDVFDRAFEDGVLHRVDLFLRKKALEKFARFQNRGPIKLFYNLDNRLFDSKDYAPGATMGVLDTLGYAREDICFEISEKHRFSDNRAMSKILSAYHSRGFKIAVDDCGTGFSGLQLLYYTEPDYIKIDQFFIRNLHKDSKKRLVVSTIVNFAHFMGSHVLAEGVENGDEYAACKQIGCDMIQGYFVQAPTQKLWKLKTGYAKVSDVAGADRRNPVGRDRNMISNEIRYIRPVPSDSDIITLFDQFRTEENRSFFPIINANGEPLGVVRDTAFKDYIFSKFGRQLLENPSFGKDISPFIDRVPIADIHSPVEKLIEIYTQHNNNEGLIMVDEMKYVGFLDTKALLKLINEKNLSLARNQNPLTKLPGNTLIHEYFNRALADGTQGYHLIYFDFDQFKPYNDYYGFRNGDRLILMFAELLKTASLGENRFVGHVGGDDFFMGVRGLDSKRLVPEMASLAAIFKKNAESFYDAKAMEQGGIMATDRGGTLRKIPLITVSVAILELPRDRDCEYSIEGVGNIIARLKKEAKASDERMAFAGIMEFLSPDEGGGREDLKALALEGA